MSILTAKHANCDEPYLPTVLLQAIGHINAVQAGLRVLEGDSMRTLALRESAARAKGQLQALHSQATREHYEAKAAKAVQS